MDELRGEFGSVIDLLRDGPSDIEIEQPGESVWAGIEAELGLAPSSADLAGERIPPSHRSESAKEQVDTAPVISLSDAREKRSWGKRTAVFVAAAAAALLVAVPVGLSFASGDDAIELAADLDALDGFAGSGRAEVDGDTLVVDVEGLDAPDGSFYELWLLDVDGDDVQTRSIGRIAEDGTFMIDPTIDLDEFSVVDISIEADDGDDSHSGNSVLRGPLS